MLDDLQAEYARLREELGRLQRERARLDVQKPPNPDEERNYALQLKAVHREVVAYIGRLERLQSDDRDSKP